MAVLPLIQSLKHLSKWHQSWYADDSACAGKLQLVGNWFDLLLKLGPSYGYFPEPSKCFIIVAVRDIIAAHCLFKDLGVQVTTGHCFLGGIIGNDESKRKFVGGS